MSPPAEKARPAPVITSARSSDGGSCDNCATEACTASPISTVMAFRLSGRSSVNTFTPLCSSSSTRTAVLSFCTGTARRQAACIGGSSLDERDSMGAKLYCAAAAPGRPKPQTHRARPAGTWGRKRFLIIAHASLHKRAPRATPRARHAVLIPCLWSLGYPPRRVAHGIQCTALQNVRARDISDIVGVRGGNLREKHCL